MESLGALESTTKEICCQNTHVSNDKITSSVLGASVFKKPEPFFFELLEFRDQVTLPGDSA